MIAIFDTEKESINYSNYIQSFLLKDRSGYNAEKWSNVNKSDNDNKWCIKLPIDYKDLELNIDGLELTEKLPDNWRNNVELNI